MNKIKFSTALMIVAGIFSSMTFAQSSAKASLTSLFELSKAKSFEKAAALIAYDGEDKARIKKNAFNVANKDELSQVKRICKKISALIELSSKYDFGTSSVKQEGESEIQLIEVNFISGDQKLVTEFSFIKTEKGYLLFNMN
ncbi:MAG: hypothetical protein WCZ90_08515 [Melioribacteraceae bacterium]